MVKIRALDNYDSFVYTLIETGLEGELNIDKVRHYFDHQGFITPIADDLANQISSMYEQGLTSGDISIMFATHSNPTAMGSRSGSPSVP